MVAEAGVYQSEYYTTINQINSMHLIIILFMIVSIAINCHRFFCTLIKNGKMLKTYHFSVNFTRDFYPTAPLDIVTSKQLPFGTTGQTGVCALRHSLAVVLRVCPSGRTTDLLTRKLSEMDTGPSPRVHFFAYALPWLGRTVRENVSTQLFMPVGGLCVSSFSMFSSRGQL